MIEKEKGDDFFQFTRYLRRANLVRDISDKEMNIENDATIINEIFLLFFALLYVVVEVFKELKFQDEIILFLLSDKYRDQVGKLRHMRNTVFHPDKSVISERQNAFFDDLDIIIPWAYTLYDEFERFLYFYPELNGITGEDAEDLRLEIKKLHDWLPKRSLSIRKKECLEEINEYKDSLKKLNTKESILELHEIEIIEEKIKSEPNSIGLKFGILLNNKYEEKTRP